MISSRPLNSEDFLEDSNILSDTYLPPMIEYDVIYYYAMDEETD